MCSRNVSGQESEGGATDALTATSDERRPEKYHQPCSRNIPRQHQEWLRFQGEARRVHRVLVEIGLETEWLHFRQVCTLAARTDALLVLTMLSVMVELCYTLLVNVYG